MVALVIFYSCPWTSTCPTHFPSSMYSYGTVHPLRPLPICALVWEQEQLKGKQWCYGSEHTHSTASLLRNISCWAGERSQNYHQLFPKLFWHRVIEESTPQAYSWVMLVELKICLHKYTVQRRENGLDHLSSNLYTKKALQALPTKLKVSNICNHLQYLMTLLSMAPWVLVPFY